METSELSIRSHLHGLLSRLAEAGYEAVVAAQDLGGLAEFASSEGVRAVGLPLTRAPSPGRDALSLISLLRLISREKPDLLVYGTPKAGLLTALAGACLGTPSRLYVLHGFRYETARGVSRLLLKAMERLTMRLSHAVVCVSPALKRLTAEEFNVARDRVQVLGRGSASGVNLERFRPLDEGQRQAAKRRFGLRPDAFTFLFVGRLTRDKGIYELLEAFTASDVLVSETQLLIVGDLEMPAEAGALLKKEIDRCSGVTWLGNQSEMADIVGLADCMVLPTYREGLPNVLLEAAAAAVPIISTQATGVTDLVTHGSTGTIVPVLSVRLLTDAMLAVYRDPEAGREMARSLRAEVVEHYDEHVVLDRWVQALSQRVHPRR